MSENNAEQCPKISVIIPVYNTAPYIRECMDSLMREPCFEHCEVLFVNDGSTDGSQEILETYAEKMSNVQIFSHGQEPFNRGLSAARNKGLENAQGQYVFFLDSDDTLTDSYLTKLLNAIEQNDSDIIYAGLSVWTEGKVDPEKRTVLEQKGIFTGIDFLSSRMNLSDHYNFVCSALYKKSFLQDKQITFAEEMRLYEDLIFTGQTMIAAKKVAVLPIYGYLYRKREESLVGSGVQIRDIEGMLQVLDKINQIASDDNRLFWARFSYEIIGMGLYYIGTLAEQKVIDRKAEREFLCRMSELVSFKMLLKAAKTRKDLVKWVLWRLDWRLYYPLVRKH